MKHHGGWRNWGTESGDFSQTIVPITPSQNHGEKEFLKKY